MVISNPSKEVHVDTLNEQVYNSIPAEFMEEAKELYAVLCNNDMYAYDRSKLRYLLIDHVFITNYYSIYAKEYNSIILWRICLDRSSNFVVLDSDSGKRLNTHTINLDIDNVAIQRFNNTNDEKIIGILSP